MALNGARLDASNTLKRMTRGPTEELALYKSQEDGSEDADKLEDLGFLDGANLSAAVDEWARRAAEKGQEGRFSSYAPGLLTDFGETQYPNLAVKLFDALICNAGKDANVMSLVGEDAPQRDWLVDALGCFGGAVKPLTETADGVEAFFDKPGVETLESGKEWLARYTPPAVDKNTKISDFAEWRRQIIARIALNAAGGVTNFDAAADALEAVHLRTLANVFELACKTAPKEEKGAGQHIALHVFDGAGAHLPGSATYLGFIADKKLEDEGEAFACRFLDMLKEMGRGVFAITPDVSHRPGGVAGPLVPDLAAFKSYVTSEAVAHDQIMLARGHVIAGPESVADQARDALRGAVSGARRADILFRDLDRARAQRMRRERPSSDWDIDRLEGGRFDVELVISTLIFKYASAHPFVQDTTAGEALEAMARSDLISEESAQALKSARAFWARLQLVRALAQWSDPVRSPVRGRFGKLVARAAGVQKFEHVRPLMRGYAEDVTRQYSQIVLGRPPLSVVAKAAG
jgi:glutamine synthetase adenylyltransferase